MPTFEIPDGPTTVELARSGGDPKTPAPAQGSAVFNVTNKSTESRAGRLSVQIAGSSKAEWFTVEGDRQRTFAAGETQTATIRISVPANLAAGDYLFRLRAVAENDPDNDYAEGPVTTAKVPKVVPVTGGGIPWWVWLLIGLVVLAALGVGAYFLLKGGKDAGGPANIAENNTAPPPATPPPATPTVPKFVDQNVDTIAPNASGYQIIKNETANTGKPPRIVYEQDPAPNTALEPGKKVILSYEPGLVVPPLPENATFSSATNALRGAGLEPGSFLCDPASGTPGAQVGKVTAFDPGPGTKVASGSKVNMRAIQEGRCLMRFIPIDRIRIMQRMDSARPIRFNPGG